MSYNEVFLFIRPRQKRLALHRMGGVFCALLLLVAAMELYAFWGVHWGICFMVSLCFPAIFWVSFQWGLVCDDIRYEIHQINRAYAAALIERTDLTDLGLK